jgi:hypothetical protein
MRSVAILLLSTLVLSGCAHDYQHAGLRARLQDEGLQVVDEEICNALAMKPQLTFPCRIAVHLAPGRDWRWTAQDKALMEQWAIALREEGIASDVFLMSDMFVTGISLKDLRVAAARHGADALFVIQGKAEVEKRLNAAAVFNVTGIGGYLVPASHREALFTMQGGLLDVGNSFLYASVESEGEAALMRPTFLIEDKDAITKAKDQALARFGPALLQRLRCVRESCSRTAP